MQTQNMKIDESLYSRQLYTIGFDVMDKLLESDILISGMSGLGVEIAKNAILQGCRKIVLHDTYLISEKDKSTNYYISDQDIGQNRALSVYKNLSELNSNVIVEISTINLTSKYIKTFNVVVLVDCKFNFAEKINNYTHNHNIKFIYCNTLGLLGQIFCDFGKNFISYDINGENVKTCLIKHISNDVNPIVECHESTPHNMSSGDFIRFTNVSGMSQINDIQSVEIEYVNKISFRIKLDTTFFDKYIDGGQVFEVKQQAKFEFKSLSESVKNPEFNTTYDLCRSQQLHALFRSRYCKDLNETMHLSKHYCQDISDETINHFFNTKNGKIVPLNSIIGGVVSLEILKACGQKYTPIIQWFYLDAFECLSESATKITNYNLNSRYSQQIKIFGEELQEKISNMKYLIVGSGAIGCELLKNFAMIGLGTGLDGKIYVTDMDTIEKSNLNRQFLFRNNDIGKFKSRVASIAVSKMNPDINVEAHINRIGSETEHIYDSDFFKNLDGVANALDNIPARLYVDKRCLLFKKPLLESGTTGTKANVQVVIPHITESYASSSDDTTEKSIPICTIKSFPYMIEHTIQWAREHFEDLFVIRPQQTITYKNDNSVLEKESDKKSMINNINYITNNTPKSFDDCIKTAYDQWFYNFNYQINELLDNHPQDSEIDGIMFWSGTKKCPKPLVFDIYNETHTGYIYSFAKIWAKIFGLNAESFKYTLFVLQNFIIQNNTIKPDQDNFEILPLINYYKITPTSFEKDDDSNFHIDFITNASNLRASNYDIKQENKHITKGIVGKIIPALAATTSVVAGLVTLELYKIAQNFNKIEKFKNTFLNLALPFLGSSEPLPTPKTCHNLTIWDTFIIDSDITLGEFVNKFKYEHKLNLENLMYESFMIYGSLINENKINERLKMNIKKIIETELQIIINNKSILLQIGVSAENDTEFYDVLYYF